MTKVGHDAIEEEIRRLWHEERPMVVAEVSAAAELGDRSENAAYIYGKKRLRGIDGRIRYLRRKTDKVIVVDCRLQPPRPDVAFGAVVQLEDEEGNERLWRLVDEHESDPKAGRISMQSPVGRALVGKTEGDEVTVKTPGGDVFYEIVSLRYGGGPP